MTSSRGIRALVRLTVVAAAACLAACSAGQSAVQESGIDPVPLEFEGPTYLAGTDAGVRVRSGEDETVLPTGGEGRWLPNGTALVEVAPRKELVQVVDPATGRVGRTVRAWDMPGRSVTQINVLDNMPLRTTLRAYSLTLEPLWDMKLPYTDNPDATAYNELARNYYGVAPTIDGVTFAQWHDGSEWYEGGDYGVARIEDGELENVLINERIVALYLSADGTGLLALRQSEGEPCGGCSVDQEIVEIDPQTGEISAEYGTPPDYTEDWRVDAMDKVGDRVAVRYRKYGGESLIGTYVYDGEWTLLEGSDEEITWYQGGGDLVLARPAAGAGWEMSWVHDGETSKLEGAYEYDNARTYVPAAIAGQLLPPD